MNQKLSKILWILFLLFFLVIGFQQFSQTINKAHLYGAITPESKPELNRHTWKDKSFQKQFDKYQNQNFGFRNFFVKLNNQLKYSVFNVAKTEGGMVGKEGFLYIFEYIKEHCGFNYAGSEKYNSRLNDLYKLNDFCNSNGKELLFVYAPNKATFYSEYIPDRYQKRDNLTNYDYVKSQLVENEIPLIDFNKWFVDIKTESPYPLIPKTGTHWSVYGMYLAMDSITSYLEKKRNVDLPEIVWESIVVTDSAHKDDADIEVGMNLLSNLDDGFLAYPKVRVNNKNKDKLNVLIISDSFYWGLYNRGYNDILGGEHTGFWFYYRDKHPRLEEDYNLYDLLMKQDVILIMHTASTTPLLGYGFLKESVAAINNPNFNYSQLQQVLNSSQLESYKKTIMEDENWMEQIKIKAKEKSISIDSMVTLDAIWSLKQRGN